MKRPYRFLALSVGCLLAPVQVKASPPPPPTVDAMSDPTAAPAPVQRAKPRVQTARVKPGLPGGVATTKPASASSADPFSHLQPRASTPMAAPPTSEAWRPPKTDLYDPEHPEHSDLDPDSDAWRPPAGVPGSGLPRDPTTADRSKLMAPLPRRASDKKEAEGLAELEGIAKHYRRVALETEDSLRTLFVLEADAGKQALLNRYDKAIDVHLARSRSLRAKAITRYNDFLKLHPNDASWTPEISFRLAELYFEAANERLRVKEDAWQKQIAALAERAAAGKEVGDPPPSPAVDYSPSVTLFRRVAADFPRYGHSDAARYMMGLLLYEQEDFDAGRQALLSLVCADHFSVPSKDQSNVIPSAQVKESDYEGCTSAREGSKFEIESWLRIGEIHYDVDELGPAEAAYAQASADPDDKLYNAALIRLAWTLYLRRKFADAVDRFDEFILYADSVKGTVAARGAAEYRDEAIRYLAKSYVEQDWNLDGKRDRLWGIKRLDRDYAQRKDEPHVPEIYAALGAIWAEEDDLGLAVDLWEQVLRRWPNSRKAPQLRMRLFEAYSQLQERDNARKSRDALATSYLRGTEWFYANENDTEAIEAAMKLVEDALVAVAIDHHERAQSLRVEGDPKAKGEYEIASRAYAAYLERFPDTESSYEYRFQYADTLYFSSRYIEAAQQFAAVRDSNLDNRLQADASESVLAALESYTEEEKDAGRFAMPALPKQGTPGPFEPVAPPAIVIALQEAYDRHVGIRPDAENTPATKFKAAALSQRYYDFENAERRFLAILEDHCDKNVAINAGYAIIDSYIVRGDLASTREWTEKLGAMGCGEGEASAKFAGELKIIGNAVRFKEANILFEEGKFEMAADRYLALVDETPDDPDADRALNNAAVAYEKIGRFSSASATYTRIYTKYPDSEFADDALLRTGLNHARFFEFDEAVKSYLRLAEDKRYEDSEHRLNALKNAANLLDGLQQYKRAAELHRKYAAKTEDEIERAEALFRAAKILGKTRDHKRTIKGYQAYLRVYESVPDEAEHVVESYLRIGIAQAALRKRRSAETAYRMAVGIFGSSGLKAAGESADLASEAQFRLAEYALKDVLKVHLTGTGKKFDKQAKQLFDEVVVAAAEYDAVFSYRRIEWVLAAMFRRGYAFETVAKKVRAAPVPSQLKHGSEAWFAYKDLVDKSMSAFENKAVFFYEETVKRSREYKISNEWTQRARERLNVYKPDEYPLLRPAAVSLEVKDRR